MNSLSHILDQKKEFNELVQEYSSVSKYSNDWQVVKNKVDMLPIDWKVYIKQINPYYKKSYHGDVVKYIFSLPSISGHKVYLYVLFKNEEPHNVYYCCINKDENVAYIRTLVDILNTKSVKNIFK